MPTRPFYGIFNAREWVDIQRFADRERCNVSELIRRGIRALAVTRGFVIPFDERKDYFERPRRSPSVDP